MNQKEAREHTLIDQHEAEDLFAPPCTGTCESPMRVENLTTCLINLKSDNWYIPPPYIFPDYLFVL